MLQKLVQPQQVQILEKSLAGAGLRQRVISNNIANVNTPGFKRSEVAFEEILQQQLSGGNGKISLNCTNAKHITPQPGNNTVAQRLVSDNTMRLDGNNVDIDAEMANMAKNTIYYDAVTQQMSRYFSSLKNVIREGR